MSNLCCHSWSYGVCLKCRHTFADTPEAERGCAYAREVERLKGENLLLSLQLRDARQERNSLIPVKAKHTHCFNTFGVEGLAHDTMGHMCCSCGQENA